MWIHNISIRGLKNIQKIEIDFHKKVTLIYGQNGMGKTTILESISLLGHLPTMRQIKLTGSGNAVLKHSSLLQMSEAGELVEDDTGAQEKLPIPSGNFFSSLLKELKRTYVKEDDYLDNWFKHFILVGPIDNKETVSDGLIRFNVSFQRKCSENDKFVFFVFFKNTDDVSITKTLGSKSFNDVKMNDTYALIWEERYDTNVTKLLDYLSKTTKFLVPIPKGEKGENNALNLVKHQEHDKMAESLNSHHNDPKENTGFTFYLNTDLNDFGRARDVRESVKDIFGDFINEWIKRLNINFIPSSLSKDERDILQEKKVFEKKEDLQQKLNAILTPSFLDNFWGDFRTNQNKFNLETCSINKYKDGKWKPDIRVGRYKSHSKVKLDYLSAGENECFFIFMYLLGVNINNSICLLDEPDLHLSQFSKKLFYDSLYSLLTSRNCQVIISTHSGSAYSDPAITKRLYVRKKKKFPEHVTNHSIWFSILLAWQYLKISMGVLGWTFTVYLIALAGFVALASDVWTAIDRNDAETHKKILYVIVFTLFYILGGWHFLKCVSSVKRNLSNWEHRE